MAKEFTAAELMAMVQALGAQTMEELEALASDTTKADAATAIESRLINGAQTVEVEVLNEETGETETETMTLAESWADFFFDMTERFVGDFSTETIDKPGRGSGKRHVTKVEVITPRGTAFFRVNRDA